MSHTVEITPPPRRFVSQNLIDLRELGAWAKGTLFGFEASEENYADFITRAREFAFGSAK
jgi:hypothetical protein